MIYLVIDVEMFLIVNCKQWIVQLYFEHRMLYGNVVMPLLQKGFGYVSKWCEKLYGSTTHMERFLAYQAVVRRFFKPTHEMLDAVEGRMKQDEETSTTQLMNMLEERRFKILKHMVNRARKTLWRTFHGSYYCHMIHNANNKKVQWRRTTAQYHWRCVVDWWIYYSTGDQLDVLHRHVHECQHMIFLKHSVATSYTVNAIEFCPLNPTWFLFVIACEVIGFPGVKLHKRDYSTFIHAKPLLNTVLVTFYPKFM